MTKTYWTILAILSAGAIAVGAAVASSEDPPGPRSSSPLDHSYKRGSETAEGTAASPRGGSPYAVAVTETTDGRTCVAPGRLRGGRVVMPARGQKDLPATEAKAGFCHDLGALSDATPIAYTVSWELYDPESGARATTTRVYGLARPGVERVTLRWDGGSRTMRVHRNAFIGVVPGTGLSSGYSLTAEHADGTEVTLREAAADPSFQRLLEDPPDGKELEEMSKRHSAHGG